MPLLSRAAEIASPPSSIAVNPLSAPDSLPMGVRAPPTITEPVMCSLLSLLGQVEVGDGALERLGRHGDGLGEGGVGVDGQADVGRVGAGFDGQCGLGDQV